VRFFFTHPLTKLFWLHMAYHTKGIKHRNILPSITIGQRE
jgi:hypothetical protein